MKTLHSIAEVRESVKKEFVMIIGKSRTCSACKIVLDMLKKNVSNIDQIEIEEVYIDDVDEFRGEFLVFSVPTVLIFSEGKELLKESRYIDYAKIERLISNFIQ